MKIIKEPAFRTWDLGELPGTPQTEETQGALDELLIKRPEEKAGKTGESFVEFSTRVLDAIKKIVDTAPANTVVVTHNSVYGLIKLWDAKGRPKNLDKPFRTVYTKQGSETGEHYEIKGKNGTIYICRHGETEDNKKGLFRTDEAELTEKGTKEAEELAKDLSKINISQIISSPLDRTIETSQMILDEQEEAEPEEKSEGVSEEADKGATEESESKGLCKSTFLYMEPKGDGKEFAQCGTCWKFTGKSCLEFSPDEEVGADDSCGLYNQGKPAKDMMGKESGGTDKKTAGFVDGVVRCENCEYFEKGDKDCLLFRILGMIDYKVKPKACCNAFSAKGKGD